MPSATSCAEPASTPTWSRVRDSRVTPVRGIVPKLGFMPQTPQKAAGRTTEPAVWVPSASGTPPAATVAAEPEEEPPGVRPERVRVAGGVGGTAGKLGGHGLAEDQRARRAQASHHRGIRTWPASFVERRAVLGRLVGGIDDVLDGHRNAREQAARAGSVDRLRPRRSLGGVEMAPRLNRWLGRGDALQRRVAHGLPPCSRARPGPWPQSHPRLGHCGSAGAANSLLSVVVIVCSPVRFSPRPRRPAPGALPLLGKHSGQGYKPTHACHLG